MSLFKKTKQIAAITLLIATAANAQVQPLQPERGHETVMPSTGNLRLDCFHNLIRKSMFKQGSENRFSLTFGRVNMISDFTTGLRLSMNTGTIDSDGPKNTIQYSSEMQREQIAMQAIQQLGQIWQWHSQNPGNTLQLLNIYNEGEAVISETVNLGGNSMHTSFDIVFKGAACKFKRPLTSDAFDRM